MGRMSAEAPRFKMRAWCEVSVRQYLRFFKDAHEKVPPTCKLMAVVKANAYGLGSTVLAKAVEEAKIVHYFAVATPNEGQELREAGIRLPILLLSEPQTDEIPIMFEAKLIPTLYSVTHLKALAKEARARGIRLPVHLKLDTGMNRLGCNPKELAELVSLIQQTPSLWLEGIMTHLSCADEPENPMTAAQLSTFETVVHSLNLEAPLILHVAGSAAFQHFPTSHLGLVRLGIASFEHIVTIKSRVLLVKAVSENEPVSYGATYRTSRPTQIATISMGYADGIPRSFQGEVLIGGKRYPTAGRVCMDLMMVDLGPDADVQKGDEVVFLGHQGQGYIGPEEFSRASNRIIYESLCALGPRVKRVYV